MKMFHQARNGMVWVRGGAGHYGETREQFEADHGRAMPLLPNGITERIYEPGVRHTLVCNDSVVDGGPMPWPEGDAAIAKLSTLLAKKKKREDDQLENARKKVKEEADEMGRQAIARMRDLEEKNKAMLEELEAKNKAAIENIARKGG